MRARISMNATEGVSLKIFDQIVPLDLINLGVFKHGGRSKVGLIVESGTLTEEGVSLLNGEHLFTAVLPKDADLNSAVSEEIKFPASFSLDIDRLICPELSSAEPTSKAWSAHSRTHRCYR